MESVASLVFNAENVRMLVLLVFGFCGYVLLKTSFEKRMDGQDRKFDALDRKIDSVEASLSSSLGNRIDALDRKIDGVEASLSKRIDALDRKIDSVEASLSKRMDVQDHKIDCLESSLLKAMDEKIAAANQNLYAQLKANDFKHLNDTIEALTFTLEKNGFLKREDKEYIDGRLDK